MERSVGAKLLDECFQQDVGAKPRVKRPQRKTQLERLGRVAKPIHPKDRRGKAEELLRKTLERFNLINSEGPSYKSYIQTGLEIVRIPNWSSILTTLPILNETIVQKDAYKFLYIGADYLASDLSDNFYSESRFMPHGISDPLIRESEPSVRFIDFKRDFEGVLCRRGDSYGVSAEYLRSLYKLELGQELNTLLVYEDDVPIAFCAVKIGEDYMEIAAVCKKQGAGIHMPIFPAIMGIISAYAQMQNNKSLQLFASTEKVIRVYENFGFQLTSISTGEPTALQKESYDEENDYGFFMKANPADARGAAGKLLESTDLKNANTWYDQMRGYFFT